MSIRAMLDLFELFIYFLINPVVIIILVVLVVMCIVGLWNMYEKAGYDGWKCLIPFYGTYLLYEMAFGEGRGWMFLLSFVPYLGAIMGVVLYFKLAQAFGKHVGYTLGLLFFMPVFVMILGLGDACYEGSW